LTFLVLFLTASRAIAQNQAPSAAFVIRTEGVASAPNPFPSSTQIRYTLPQRVPVVLAVYDVQGRRLVTLVDRTEDPGEYTVTWGGRGDSGLPAASGLYFLRLLAGKEIRVQKAILSR